MDNLLVKQSAYQLFKCLQVCKPEVPARAYLPLEATRPRTAGPAPEPAVPVCQLQVV
jgi:hypothetical protein